MFPVRIPLPSKRVRYAMVVVVAVGDIILSLSHGDPMTTIECGDPGVICINFSPLGITLDKWLHGLGYALLTATLAYAFEDSRSSRRNQLVLAVCIAVVFGGIMELVQGPTPQRTMSGLDALANTIGACLVAVLWWKMKGIVQFGERDGGQAPS